MKISESGKAEWNADAAEESLKTVRSYHKFAHSPAYRMYRLSLSVGEFTMMLVDACAKGVENLWRMTLSDAFVRVVDFFREFTELKKSRFVRGDFSITRGIFRAASDVSSALVYVSGVFLHKGASDGWKAICRLVAGKVKGFWADKRRALNYLAPVAGIAVLAVTIYAWSNLTIAVSVRYNNKNLGVISSEQVFTVAANNVEAKVSEASGASYVLNASPVYTLKIAQKSDLLDEDELYDGILSASSADVESGYGLYVDSKLVGSNSDNTAIQSMLDSIVVPYKTDTDYTHVSFYQDVQIKKGVFPKSVERTTVNMKAILTASVKNTQTYTAQKGDSLSMVANMFHMSVDQLYAMNTAVQPDGLSQGEPIQVVNPQPTLQVQYTKREVSMQAIPYQVVSTQSGTLAKGRTKITQQGQNGVMQMTNDVTYVGNTVVATNTVKTEVLKVPVNQYQQVGTFDFSAKAMSLVDYAEHFEGSNYHYGASGPYSFDCSGYTMYIFSKYGISLPHSAAGQAGYGTYVSKSNLQAGDLVFFNTYGGGISHVGIYIGGGEFINALNPRSGVTYNSLNSGWGSYEYVTARRVW